MSTFKEDLIEYALKDSPPLMQLGYVTQHYEHGPHGELIPGEVEREFIALPGVLRNDRGGRGGGPGPRAG